MEAEREVKEAARAALVLLAWVAAFLPPCQAACLRDAMRCAERATGVALKDE